MIRALPISLAALALMGCMTPPSSKPHTVAHTGVWNRNQGVNADAAKVQATVARQAKEARCKGEVRQRQGTDGTSPRNYKCKEAFA